MDTSYCVGGEADFGRMFDQYLHKGSGSFDLSLSVPESTSSHHYMAEHNNYAPYESGSGESYTELNPMTTTAMGGAHEPPNSAAQQQQQQHPHPQHQAMYQMGGLHATNPQFPPQNLYIPPISQQGTLMAAQTTGYIGQGIGGHAPPLYTNAGLGLPSHHAPPGMMPGAGGMLPAGYYNPRPPHMIRSGGSPTSGGSPSPGSDDSDDSAPTGQGGRAKRPSPEVAPEPVAPTKGKKARVSKKGKKKKDPNEPQKPVSAYALFFRDTQATIKGQNPSASFGEVSKIVASMWDSLGAEQKGVYKKKTEAAKKEYLKALAAYRATLVSKGEGDPMFPGTTQNFGQFGANPSYGFPPATSPGAIPPHTQGHSPPQLSPLAKKTPLLSSLMTGDPGQQSLMNPPMSQPMPPSAPQMIAPHGPPHPSMNPGAMGPGPQGQPGPPPLPHQPVASPQGHLTQMGTVGPPTSPYMTQASLSLGSPVSNMGSEVASPGALPMHKNPSQQQQQHQQPPATHPQQQQQQQHSHHSPQQQQQPVVCVVAPQPRQSPPQQPPQASPQDPSQSMAHPNANMLHCPPGSNQGGGGPPGGTHPGGTGQASSTGVPYCNDGSCVRSGCHNPAVLNPEWEDEYCSNECVVSHCRDVFCNSFGPHKQGNTPTYPAPVK